nr:Ku protein [Streptomyces thermoviolaceus]
MHVRSIWNGAISFGLVSIPIKLVNATESHSVSFRQIHTQDGGRIRYRKVCELEDREVSQAEIGKGYEEADGTIVPITDEDLAHLPLPTAKTIDIVAFVPADRIDPLQLEHAYYLAANGASAAKPYTLLREALRRSNRVAIAKFALRGRERLGMLRVVDDVIVMHGLLWPDEIRAPQDAAPDVEVSVRDKELDLADALMDTLGEVDLADLHDEYREALEEVIAAKTSGETPPEAPQPATGGKVLDLMAALENSVRAAKQSRGEAVGETDEGTEATAEGGEEAGEDEEAEVRHLPRRKSAASRTAASRTASGKAGTGKAAQTDKATAKKTTGAGASRKTASRTAQQKQPSKEKKTARTGTGKTAAKKTTTSPKKTAARKRTA